MNQNIKTSVGVAVIIILAITAGVFVWMAQKNNPIETPVSTKTQKTQSQANQLKDETTGWQVYTNEKYGFTFKYPAGTTLTDSSNLIQNNGMDDRLLLLSFLGNGKAFNESGDSGYNASITVHNNNSPTTAGAKSQDVKNIFVEKDFSTPNGKFILQDSYGMDGDVYFLEAYFLGSSYTYNFELSGEKYQKDTVDLFKKMLSTAKFTDETADWQTYRNEKHGFEFKYPKDLIAVDNSSLDGTEIDFHKTNREGALLITMQIFPGQKWSLADREKMNKSTLGEKVITEAIKFSGVDALKTKFSESIQSPGDDEIYFLKDGNSFILSLSITGTPNLSSEEQQILSTFKFTN